jgi:hypothetical protein
VEETVARVLAHVERALVVSLRDDMRIIHANPAMCRFLPGITPNMPVADFTHHVNDVYESENASERVLPVGLRVVARLKEPGQEASRYSGMLGGMWILGSHLPFVEAFPPSALITFHHRLDSQEARAWRVHHPIAYATSLALEMDEARRELELGSQMIVQAHSRLAKMATGLVDYQAASYRELIDGGINLEAHRGSGSRSRHQRSRHDS